MESTRATPNARDRCKRMLFTNMHRLSVDNLWKTPQISRVSLSA